MPKKMAVKAIMMSQPGPFSSEDASGPPLVPREHTKRPKTAKMPCEQKMKRTLEEAQWSNSTLFQSYP